MDHKKIKLVGETSEYGFFVTGIAGVNADGDKFQFWSLEVNGEMSMVGIGDIKPKDKDVITFKLITWQ